MRDIKFRAWDKFNKRFGYFQLQANLLSTPTENFMSVQKNDGQLRFPEIEGWQEFTGLKDKSGKEIYEGDIVMSGGVRKIEWEGGSFWAKSITPPGNYPLHFITYQAKIEIEVIGNIYGNPELLEIK